MAHQMIWSGACRVFIDKLASLRALAAGSTFTVSDGGPELRAAVEKVITDMTVFAASSPLMSMFPSLYCVGSVGMVALDAHCWSSL